MAVDTKHPGDIGRNLLFQLEQGARDLVEVRATFRLEIGLSGVEEYLGLKDETVADHADIGAIAEDFPQLSEEVRPITFELVHPLRQRDVQALAEFRDAALGILILFFGGIE